MDKELVSTSAPDHEVVDTELNNDLVPLIVDLDGTLVSTDTLWESFLRLCHIKPWMLLLLPVWLIQGGRAKLKAEISNQVSIDVVTLPYRHDVIDKIIEARKNSRLTILATAANQDIANNVAEHLGIFDNVIASTHDNNLKAEKKLTAIQDYLGNKPFDYIGDSKADMPVWNVARKAFIVSPSKTLKKSCASLHDSQYIGESNKVTFKILLRAIRLHQWAKNLLLFIPLILSQRYLNIDSVTVSSISFLVFGLCASSTYLWNDLLDLPTDRQHETKKNRPLAAGDISIVTGIIVSFFLMLVAFLISVIFLPSLFTVMLLGYIALTVSYTFYFKRQLMTDVIMLGGLYAYRILIGAVAIDVMISPWLFAFSIFFFLSLAFVKRFTDLNNLPRNVEGKVGGRAYYAGDLDMVRSLGTSASYISVLIMALYVNSPTVINLYPRPGWLWLLCIIFLYWLSRIWFLAERNQMPDDPVLFAVKDKISYLVGISVLAILLIASF